MDVATVPRDAVDEAIERHARANVARWVEALAQLCRAPSVSAENRALTETAEVVRRVMGELGVPGTVVQTKDAPAVVARVPCRARLWLLVVYTYDVQTVGPQH